MKRHPVLVFVLLTLIFSWVWLIPLALASHETISFPVSRARAALYSAYGPGLAALIVTLLIGGVDGLRNLLGRFVRWRAGLQWYVIAVLLPVLPLALHMLFGGSGPHFASETEPQAGATAPTLTPLNAWAQIMPLIGIEIWRSKVFIGELAWRGFLLPQMQRGMSALLASILVGAVWCLSILPLVFERGGPYAGVQWFFMALGIVASSVTYTWIFNNSNGSLLTAVLFNLSNAVTGVFILAAGVQNLLFLLSNLGVAALVVVLAGPRYLTRDPDGAARAIADDPNCPAQQPI
jgi:membrane protease YdiL (CAAX protease family)